MGGQVRQIIDRFEFQPQRKAAATAVREFPTAAASVRELVDQFNGLLDERDCRLDWVGRRPMQFRRHRTSESSGREEKLQVCHVETKCDDDALKVDEVRPVERVKPEAEKQTEISEELLVETETISASAVEVTIVTVAEESTESDASTVDVAEEQSAEEEPPVAASEEPRSPITGTPETHDDQLAQDPSEESALTTDRDAVKERSAPIVVDSGPAKDELTKQQYTAPAEPESVKSKSPLSTSRPSKPVPSAGPSDKVTSRYLAYQATSRYAQIQEANIQRRKMNELKRSEQAQQTVRSTSRTMGHQGTRAAKSVPAARRQTLECSKLSKAPKSALAKRPQSAPATRQPKPVVCRDTPAPEAPTGRPRRASAPNFSAAGLSVPKAPSSTGSIKRAPVQRSSSTESHRAKLKNVQSRLFAFETDPQHLQKVEANRSRVVSLKMRSERVAR